MRNVFIINASALSEVNLSLRVIKYCYWLARCVTTQSALLVCRFRVLFNDLMSENPQWFNLFFLPLSSSDGNEFFVFVSCWLRLRKRKLLANIRRLRVFSIFNEIIVYSFIHFIQHHALQQSADDGADSSFQSSFHISLCHKNPVHKPRRLPHPRPVSTRTATVVDLLSSPRSRRSFVLKKLFLLSL